MIMMNFNLEIVLIDYDISDRLYFEFLIVEDVQNVIDLEWFDGIIVQFGGQILLKFVVLIQEYLERNFILVVFGDGFVKIWGISLDFIDVVEDWKRFEVILDEIGINQLLGGIV